MQDVQTLGGAQRVVTTMFNRLADDASYEILILAPKDPNNTPLYTVNSNIKWIDLNQICGKPTIIRKILKKLNSNIAYFEIIEAIDLCDTVYFPSKDIMCCCNLIQSYGVDCIIGINAYYSIFAAKIAKKINTKCVAWMHSTFEGYFRKRNQDSYGLYNLFSKYISRMDKILVLTDSDKATFIKNFPTLERKIFVQHNPITIKVQEKKKTKNTRLLYVGRLNYKIKGIDRLIPIMKNILECYPDVDLDIVGDGSDKVKFMNQVKLNNLEESIHMIGLTNDVGKYYLQSSILLVPSRLEGFGLVITEAMAYGIPVVAFHSNGPDEIIDDSVNGYLLNQGDIEGFANAVIKLLSNKTRYLSFSNAAVKRAKDFNIDNILSQLNYILEN